VALQATHMLHDPVNGKAKEGRGKDTPLAQAYSDFQASSLL